MYGVTINGKSSEVKSYAAATSDVKAAASIRATSLVNPIRNGIYRSPKHTTRVNAERLASANKLAAGIKFPKTAGDVAGKLGGLSYAIVRK